MCAVIGAVIRNPSSKDLEGLRRVFLESKIRGMHATGVSYIKDNRIITDKRPVPADQFPFDFKNYINEDGTLYLVGHCRYSTSDLEFNQPISNGNTSVVHNGVITQELPEKWSELYGYVCETKNDTELLLHTIEDGVCALERWKDSSMSVCVLEASKKLTLFRNGKRPIYLTTLPNGCIVTSTADIPKRADLYFPTMEVPMNVQIAFDEKLTMSYNSINVVNAKDLQPNENPRN